MTENNVKREIFHYILLCVLGSWALAVVYFYYRVHPIAPGQLWQTILGFRLPPPPTDPLKIALALKHTVLACVMVVFGVLTGQRILRIMGIRRSEHPSNGNRWSVVQDLMVSLGIGWGLLIYLVFILGVFGALYKAVILGIMAIMVLACLGEIPALFGNLKAIISSDKSGEGVIVFHLGMALLIITVFSLLVIALAPTITHDAMVYHLNVPRIYANEHRIVEVPYNLFSNTVLNIGMLYTAALLIDEFILANLIHFVFGAGTLVFLYAFARRNFGYTTAALAVLIFFFNPSVSNQMPIAYTDMAMVFYFLLSLYCLWKWREGNDKRWLFLLGICAGIFAGIKYTSIHGLIAMCSMIAVMGFFSGERRVKKVIGSLAIFGGVVTLLVSPYLLKNYLMTGNPFYPLMYEIFGGRWLVPRQVERMLAYVSSHGMGHGWRNLLALPWNITIHGNPGYASFDTIITPLWLIFLPPFVFIRHKSATLKWVALICVVYFCSWAVSTHITRYLMPMFPLLSLLCAHTIITLRKKTGESSKSLARIFDASCIGLCGLIWLSFSYSYPLRVPSEFGPVVWGTQAADEFQAKRIPNYSVFKFINDNLPPDAHLAFFWDNRGFFCERSQIGDSVFEAPTMIELVHEAGSAPAFHKKLDRMGVTHVLFNRLFLVRFPVHTVSREDEAGLAADFMILDEFLSRYCTPLYEADGATLYKLSG